MKKLLSVDAFRAEAKDGRKPDATVYRLASSDEPQVHADDSRKVGFTFSDATVDLSGDVIDQKGWELGNFEKNAVALFSHASWDPPIGRAWDVGVKNGKLRGDIEFASADDYPFADTIFRLVRSKFLKAVSVGFMPLEWKFSTDKERPMGIDFKKQSLLEISVCSVPCNPNALSEARSIGIDTRPLKSWAEHALDSRTGGILSTKELEQIREQAGELSRPLYYISSPKALSATVAKRVKDQVDHWLKASPSDRGVLILPDGLELKTLPQQDDAADWRCGAAKDLPVDDQSAWDGSAAESSIFMHAGGDNFDPTIARRGFLAYNAAQPHLRGSYKLPFAHVVDGELKAVKAGLDAAASRLPDTEIPDTTKQAARAVVDHYEGRDKKAKSGEENLVGNCGRTADRQCGMVNPQECSVHRNPAVDAPDPVDQDVTPPASPKGSCGRTAEETCGMKDSQECSVHFVPPPPAAKTAKAGRRISAATKAKIEQAIDHHAQATKCLKDIMDDPEAAGDDDAEDPVPPPQQADPVELTVEETDPVQARIAEARRITESLNTN